MQFNISKDQFLKALTKVQGIIEKKHTIPILANVLIKADNGKLIITATDLEVGVKSEYKADTVDNGSITISGKKLFEIIKELPDSIINFNTKNNYWVEIKCEKSVFNLVGLSPEDFPKFPELDTENIKIDKNECAFSEDCNLDLVQWTIKDEPNSKTFIPKSTNQHEKPQIDVT